MLVYQRVPSGGVSVGFNMLWQVINTWLYTVSSCFIYWGVYEESLNREFQWKPLGWRFSKRLSSLVYYFIWRDIHIIFPWISFIISVIRDFPLRRSPSAAASAFTPCGWSCGMPSSAPRPPPMPCWSGKWRKLGGCANDGDWSNITWGFNQQQ